MKTNKALKISLLILSLALCIGAVVAMSIGAQEAETESVKKPEIISQNVKYTDKFALMYAVDASTVADGPVKLNLYNKLPGEGVSPIKTYTVSKVTTAEGNLKKDSYVFTTDGVAATALTQLFYVEAVDAAGNKSDVKRYSVAEYLYERLAGADASSQQRAFYNSTIDFGSSAQKVIAKETDKTKYVSNYRYLTVEGGTVEGFSTGVYPIGAVLTPDDTTIPWSIITYDSIGDFTSERVSGSFTVGDGVTNKLTTKAVSYKDGIETMNRFTVGPNAWYTSDTNDRYSKDLKFYRGNGNPTIEYVNAGEHGIAAKFDLSNGGDAVKFVPNDTSVSSTDAKAFECSFDLKAMVPGSKSNEPIEIFFYSGTGSRFRMNLYIKYEDKYDALVVGSPNNGNVTLTPYNDQDPTDWMHVRAVIYANDLTKAYFYINGSEVGHCNNYAGGTVDFASIGFGIRQYTAGYYSKEVTVDGVKQNVWYGDPADEVYVLVDNYYCGYTTEANPYTDAQ